MLNELKLGGHTTSVSVHAKAALPPQVSTRLILQKNMFAEFSFEEKPLDPYFFCPEKKHIPIVWTYLTIERTSIWEYLASTPWKINMEAEHDGLVQMIFLFKERWFLGSSR